MPTYVFGVIFERGGPRAQTAKVWDMSCSKTYFFKGISHCEFVAFEKLWANGHKNLEGFDLYVTLEPCIMCAGMLRELKVSRVYFGAECEKFGGTGSILNLHNSWKT